MVELTQILASFLLSVLGLFALRGGRRNLVNQAFSLQCFVIAGWALGLAGLQGANNSLDLRFGFVFAFASLVPASFVIFSTYYPATSSAILPWHARTILAAAVTFSAFALATDLLVYGTVIGPAGLSRKTGPLYPAFATYFIVSWGAGLTVFIRKWRSARGLARAQFHYLGAALIASSAGAISTNLLIPLVTGQSKYSWVGPYFTLIYFGFIAHAIIRHRLMDLRLFINRSLTIGLSIALSALPVALLLVVFWPRLLTHLTSVELALLLVAVGIATVLIPITRDIASRLLDRYVYRTRANYRRTVREASQMLTRVLHLERLLAFISTTIVRSTAVEGVALYLRENGAFRCAVTETRSDAEYFEAPARTAVEVVAALDAAREPLLADELARERGAEAAALHERLVAANWALLLPVLSDDGLIAMIAVGPKLSGDAFYQEDLDLLMTLANQAGVAIKNAQLYTAVVVANEYLENIAATMESGVIAIDPAGRVAMFNRAAERLTGLAGDTIRGGPAAALPDCLATPLLATVEDGQPRTQPEVELPCAVAVDGERASRPVICTISPVRDPVGGVLGAVAVVSDLTPFKELEVERRRAERLAYFQALVSGIAHEIKNPMVAIRTFAQLLPRRLEDARFLEEFSRISTRETDRIQHLLDRLRTLSRPVEGPRHPLDLRAPLGQVIELVRPTLAKKSLTLETELGAEPCLVLGNHDELVQLFLNLVLNAHDATPTTGSVLIEVTRSETHVNVAVADSGPGIAPDLLERVFEPFFTTKARGSGLGLAIAAGIAQAHGAKLRSNNRPGGGAIFTLEFPAASVISAGVA